MKIVFTGDFKELKRFEKKLNQLATSNDHLKTISANLAEETVELIREGFETSTDPYGKRWDALQLRAGQPLRDSGGLQAAWHRRYVSAEGFGVFNAKNYATYHQTGTGIHGPRRQPIVPVNAKALRIPGVGFRKSVAGTPARKMVPDTNRPLPTRWIDRYVEVAEEVLSQILRQ